MKLTKEFIEEHCVYPHEPIIDTETNKIFDDMYHWYKETKGDYYDLIMESDYRYKFVNEDKLKYPLGDKTYPENASIQDVHNGKAVVYVCVPF